MELDEAKREAVRFLVHMLSVPSSNIVVTTAEIAGNQIIIRGSVKESSAKSPAFEIVYDKSEGSMTHYITSSKVCWNPECLWNYGLPYKTTFPAAEYILCPHCKSKLKEINEHP